MQTVILITLKQFNNNATHCKSWVTCRPGQFAAEHRPEDDFAVATCWLFAWHLPWMELPTLKQHVNTRDFALCTIAWITRYAGQERFEDWSVAAHLAARQLAGQAWRG